MPRSAAGALAAATLIAYSALGTAARAAPLAPLHVIPTENLSGESIDAQGPARVRITSTHPQGVAQALGITVPVGAESFDYVIDQYPQLPGAEGRSWLESTFVVDFTEPVFETMRKELGDKSTRPQIVEFVARIVDETVDRGWDLASVVARRRQGDCTEHAVLTAALARMQGLPARVAIGIALLPEGKGYGAFGHAWTEILEDGKWQVADAAMFGAQVTVRYLPMGLLEDEGMSYTMGLARLMNNWIERVVVLGPAK